LLLPPGTVLHRDLSTAFTRFDNLMSDLRQNRFSGYIRINFWEYEGILIFDLGKIIQGFSSEKENYLFAQDAVIRILEKTLEREGTIDVHSLSNEIATTLASVLGSTLYKTMDVFGGEDLKKLLGQIEGEGLTGYIDFNLSGKKGLGTIFLLEGIPVETVIMSNTGRIVNGDIVLSRILEFSKQVLCEAKIYKNIKIEHIQEEKSFLLPLTTTPALEFWNYLLDELNEEVKKATKKQDLISIWHSVNEQISPKYPYLNPTSGLLDYRNKELSIKGFIPIRLFWEGMIESLNLALNKIPTRRKKKINVAKLIQKSNQKISQLPVDVVTSNYYKTINRIFEVP
jgi:hypothetical protein